MSIALFFFMYAVCFYFAGWLIREEILLPDKFEDIFLVLMAIVFAAMVVGETSGMAPGIGEGKLAANNIIALLSRQVSLNISYISGTSKSSAFFWIFGNGLFYYIMFFALGQK